MLLSTSNEAIQIIENQNGKDKCTVESGYYDTSRDRGKSVVKSELSL